MNETRNTKHLTLDSVNLLVNMAESAESMRTKLNLPLTYAEGIRNSVLILKNYKDIVYQDVRIESGYDVHSRNYFTVVYKLYSHPVTHESVWYDESGYTYNGTREDSSVAHVWAIIEHMKKFTV